MRILYVLPAIKHPAMRGELRHYHFLRVLGRRHAVTLLALAKTDVPPDALEELRGYTERIVLVDATPPAAARPGRIAELQRRLTKVRRYARGLAAFRETFRRTVREGSFDVVLLHGNRMCRAVDGTADLPLVFDMCDAASMRLRQGLRHSPGLELPWRAFRWWQIRRMEVALPARATRISFISARDRDAVMGARRGAAIIPNGVDREYWRRRVVAPTGHSLLFTGVLDFPPNADAALYLVTRVLPEVRRAVPDVEVVLAGRNPRPELVRASEAQAGVTVTGYVNDLRPYLERATVFVAPLRFASGMQNKLLEAMAMELPVVTTGVAADGLRVDGAAAPVRVGERPEELAAHVVTLLADAEERRRLGALGRDYVARHFDWEHGAALLERLCVEAAAHGRAVTGPAVSPLEVVSREHSRGTAP